MNYVQMLTIYTCTEKQTCFVSQRLGFTLPFVPDSAIEITDFELSKSDRTASSGKTCGGGVCLFMNKSWCNNWSIKEKICTIDYELLIVGLRPFYLPRKFGQIFVFVVYVPPQANVKVASENIAAKVNDIENGSPDSAKVISGDFNQCSLHSTLPSYKQYVTQNTRNNAITGSLLKQCTKCIYLLSALSSVTPITETFVDAQCTASSLNLASQSPVRNRSGAQRKWRCCVLVWSALIGKFLSTQQNLRMILYPSLTSISFFAYSLQYQLGNSKYILTINHGSPKN